MEAFSCTIFYVIKNNKILAGNNEDWSDSYTKMWFYPPENDKHGWVKFGFGSGFPQGGLNDQGLFWDGTSNTYLEMPLSEANKEKYDGALMQKVIAECANVEEALEIFASYYCEDQYKAQYLIGDSIGNSIIIEGDNSLAMNGSYQILTNFYHSNPELGGYPCWRYETANTMLSSEYELTSYFAGSILDATHQDGKYPTKYSTIYDLKNLQLFLFHEHNFQEFIVIDLISELDKGYRSYNIPDLFSKMKLLAPANGEVIESTSITLRWEGLAESNYEVILSEDPEFLGKTNKYLANSKPELNEQSHILYFLSAVLLLIPLFKRRKFLSTSMMFLLLVLGFSKCKKEEIQDPEPQAIEFTKTMDNLLPNTTYYWKVKANQKDENNFQSETLTRFFITGSS